MKSVILLVFSLTIMFGCIGVTACAGENGGLTWHDIPTYPEAELVITRNWSVLPDEEPLSEVEWRYYEVGDKYRVSEITSFYESEMSAQYWRKISEYETSEIMNILWGYCYKINLYVPPEIAGRLQDWIYYSGNNGKYWAALWVGVNKAWEEADKCYIVIMLAR